MRRRDPAGGAAQVSVGDPPEHLRTMRGAATFLPQVEAEPVPDWVENVREWRGARAFGLWLKARREWCAANGRDYAATFHPSWLRRHR